MSLVNIIQTQWGPQLAISPKARVYRVHRGFTEVEVNKDEPIPRARGLYAVWTSGKWVPIEWQGGWCSPTYPNVKRFWKALRKALEAKNNNKC